MHTIEIDDETYASLEVLAKKEHTSVSSVVKGALSRLPGVRKAVLPVRVPHGYKISVSPSVPFTMEDVRRIEDENDMRGLA